MAELTDNDPFDFGEDFEEAKPKTDKKLKKELEKLTEKFQKMKEDYSLIKEENKEHKSNIEKIEKISLDLYSINKNMKAELDVYSTNYINDHRQEYTIYMIDPFYKKRITQDISALKKKTDNKTVRDIFEQVASNIYEETRPENIIISEENYNNIIDYFIDIDQDVNETKLVINKDYKLEIYVSETIKNKIKII